MIDKFSVDEETWQRLARCFAGEASPEDEAAVRGWIGTDPEREKMVESLREVWELSGTLPPRHHGERQRAWQRVRTHIGEERGKQPPERALAFPKQAPARRTEPTGRWRRIAAPLLAAAVLLIALVPLLRGPMSDLWQGSESVSVAMREYTTRKGERVRLILGDGSVIELGADSRLRVPARFQEGQRDVYLEGTAFFDVASDPDRPFLVHAGDAVTRVLGTQFVVRAFSADDAVQVAVVEGKVALGPNSARPQEGAVLVPGQLGRLGHDGVTSVIQDPHEFNRLVGWTMGRLEYTDQPLSEVLTDLSLWYGVEFEVTSRRLASQPVSTVVEGDSLHQVLDMIALVLDARYERSGNRIVISPQ